MISISPDTWNKLTKPSGDTLIARLAMPEITDRLHCALDAQGHRHLLVILGSSNDEYQDMQSRGVSVITRDLVVHGQELSKYLDVMCRDTNGFSIFDLIGGEIAVDLADDTKVPVDIVKRVLAKWRRFWGQLPQHILSREEQIGLFAELWFLSVWLIPLLGPNVVQKWHGPWGTRHDFEWDNKSVEVKATTNSRGRIFRIHGLGQLEEPERGVLYLFGVLLREDTSSSNNLTMLVESCKNLLLDSADDLIHFETALEKVGYTPLHRDEYSKLRLGLMEESLFKVDENFPKITNHTFALGVPPGIERIEYEINLNTFNNLIIASRPQELDFIFPK